MSFFSRLFRKAPPPQPASGKAKEQRKPAPAATTTLVRDNKAPRLPAVDTMSPGAELAALAVNPQSPLQRPAQTRLAQLLDSGVVDVPKLGAQIPDRAVLLSIASLASNPVYVDQAADLITDADVWSRLVTAGTSTKIRQLAAERVVDPEQLRRLLRDARSKDKNAYKIIRRKCDALQAQERQSAERHAAVVAVAEAIERHSYKPFDGAFVATLEHLNAQWEAGNHEAPELKPRVAQAIDRAREVISEHVRTVGAQAAKSHAIETADPQRQLIVEEMRAALPALYDADDTEDLHSRTSAQIDRWAQRWSDTTRHKKAAAADVATFDSLRSALQRVSRVLSQHGSVRRQLTAIEALASAGVGDADQASQYQALRSTLAVPHSSPEIGWPAPVSEAIDTVRAWDKKQADEAATAVAAQQQVIGLIRRANRAISDGKSSQAAGVRRAIAEALPSLQTVPGHIAGQLEQLDKRLNELQDWKSYAVTPKRAELIERMEALIGMDADPAELAAQIQQLQEEWKSLTRGSGAQSDTDWERFHAAAQKAYQPCREYFDAQAKTRAENLQRREALIAQLVQFDNAHDWANADWKEVARILRSARQEWRNYSPVERAAGKSAQTQFDALLKNMQDRLDAQYTTNKAYKQSLIDQVSRLTGETDTRKAIDDVKRLQTAWKTAGAVPHQEDQRLWEEFRQLCDAVYRRSQEEYAKRDAEFEQSRSSVIALSTQVEECAELTGAELDAAVSRVQQARTQFDAIGELPRKDSAELQARFHRAVERFERARAQQRVRNEQQSWSNLFAASNEVRLLQLATICNDGTDLTALRESARATIDGVQQWPKGGLQAIERKLSEPAPADVSANEAALRLLCIRAEILTDTPTPVGDQPLRREYQLQRLVKSVGQPTQEQAGFDSLVFEWVGTGPVDTHVYYELLERFNECLLKAQPGNA